MQLCMGGVRWLRPVKWKPNGEDGGYLGCFGGCRDTWKIRILQKSKKGREWRPMSAHDQNSAHGYSSGGRSNYGKALNTSVARNECFKCGLPGHWAKDCRSASDQMMYGTKMGTEAYSGWSNYGGGDRSSVARNDQCFKCGLPGHLAQGCPSAANQEMRGRVNNSQPEVGGEGSSKGHIVYSYGGRKGSYWEDDCFKCGRSGHWQRECPLNGGGGTDDGCDGKRREFEVSLGWPF